MTALTTNNSRRDGPARRALGADQFPSATFVLTAPVDLGDAATTDTKTAVTATGDLTVHGVTKSVPIPLEPQLTGNTIVVVGSLDVVFSDFGLLRRPHRSCCRSTTTVKWNCSCSSNDPDRRQRVSGKGYAVVRRLATLAPIIP